MLSMFRWMALISALVFVVAMAVVIVSSQPSLQPSQQQTAAKDQDEQGAKKSNVALWDRWFPDTISLYTLALVVFTAVLALAGLFQLNSLWRAEIIAAKSANASKDAANAAKDAADTSREALVKSQRAFIRVNGWPWLWRPDFSRPGKYFFDITPIVENAGATPTVDMKIVIDSALRDSALPDGFDFPYRSAPGDSLIGPHYTIGAARQIILDEDLLAVQKGTKFFYIWGTITYRDVFDGTPVHTTEFCTQITRVLGDPLDPREASNPKGTSVEITFGIYKDHNKTD